MPDVTLVNFAIVMALVPICQGLVQMLKHDKIGTYGTRILAIVIGEGLTFLVRQANVIGFSQSLQNIYTAALTGLVVALIAAGFYDMQKAGIVKSIAESATDITVPTELVGAEEDAPKSVKSSKAK